MQLSHPEPELWTGADQKQTGSAALEYTYKLI